MLLHCFTSTSATCVTGLMVYTTGTYFTIWARFETIRTEDFGFQKLYSAFATVELSLGITAKLTAVGQTIIIFLMYFGRVAPLTLSFAIMETQQKSHITMTEEKFNID